MKQYQIFIASSLLTTLLLTLAVATTTKRNQLILQLRYLSWS